MSTRFEEKLRARGKLSEAQHFLEELKKNRVPFSKFQVYLNAFMAAWRSVTLVLQKDIKTTLAGKPRENSDELMKWYEKEVQGLRALPHAKALLDLRNVVLKEGSRLPVYQFVLTGLTDELTTLELNYDASTSQFVKGAWQIDAAAALCHEAAIPFPKPMTAEEAISWIEENQAQVYKDAVTILIRQLERATSAVKQAIEQQRVIRGEIRVIIDDAGTTVAFDDFIILLEDRTKSLEQLVAEAERRILGI